MPKKTTEGQMHSDTKNTRKFNTAWGVFYLPKSLVDELGSPTTVRFTVETVEDAG